MKRILFAARAAAPVICAALFGLLFTACKDPDSAYDEEKVRVFNESSRNILLQIYTDSYDAKDEAPASDLSLHAIAPSGEEGDSVEFVYYYPEQDRHYVPQKALIVDAQTHQLLRRLSSEEFYAALAPQPPETETNEWDSVVTSYYFDLHLSDAFLSGQTP